LVKGSSPKVRISQAATLDDAADLSPRRLTPGGALQAGTIIGDFRDATDLMDQGKWIPDRQIRFSAGWYTLLTNDFAAAIPAAAAALIRSA